MDPWKRWEDHFDTHPLVRWYSLTPQPWENDDGTFDLGRLAVKVALNSTIHESQFRFHRLPREVNGYPVQYGQPNRTSRENPFALPGDSGSLVLRSADGAPMAMVIAGNEDLGEGFASPASKIEQLLNVSFIPQGPLPSYCGQYDPAQFPKDAKDRFEVLIGGISIGHLLSSAGTLGGFVWDRDTGELFGLTCAHIAAPPGAKAGDPVYQPGVHDIREWLRREPTDHDIAGYLVRWVEILPPPHKNEIDAAVFKPARPVWPNYSLKLGERVLRPPCA